MSWREDPVKNLSEWAALYARRRYGLNSTDPNVEQSWQILADSVFNFNGSGTFARKDVITKIPSLNRQRFVWYKTEHLLKAWDLMILSSKNLGGIPNYR